MRSTLWGLFVYTIIGFVISCSSDDVPKELEGTYEGIFTVEYNDGESISNPVEVSLINGKFTSSTGPNRYPAGGNGTYEVESASITFVDEGFWTADFDWNLILNGNYSYSFSGSELVLTANKNDVGIYTYELSKQ